MPSSVIILGYNSAIPTINSHPTAQLVKLNETHFLVDCGEGTQVQLRKAKAKFSKIRTILISHLHGDHVFGLVGLISTQQLLGREIPLTIIGPKGIREFVEVQLKLTQSLKSFDLEFIELSSPQPEIIFENKDCIVQTLPLNHRIYTNGFLFREKPKPKSLNMEAIRNHPEITIADYQNLKLGKDFIKSDGTMIPNSALTFEPTPPKSYAFCSDTMFHPPLVEWIHGVDLLYHEATFMETDRNLAHQTGHSTAKEAATIAQQAQVKKLILGHFSNRYGNLNELLDEAKQIFPDTYLPVELHEWEW